MTKFNNTKIEKNKNQFFACDFLGRLKNQNFNNFYHHIFFLLRKN